MALIGIQLDRKNPDAPKKTFSERFKEVTKNVFGNAEERKAYLKEAGWGSAAGLVGLGAAGAVASGALSSLGAGASAVVARSAQRLSSLAVSAVNGAMNTITTLKNKKKTFWDKAFAVAGFGITAAVIAHCCDGNTPDDVPGANHTGHSEGIKTFLHSKDTTANEVIDTAKVATNEFTADADSTSVAAKVFDKDCSSPDSPFPAHPSTGGGRHRYAPMGRSRESAAAFAEYPQCS